MEKTLETLYSEYSDHTLLQQLEVYALWTIPAVFPKGTRASDNTNAQIEHDYQSEGALLVNKLSTKLAKTLFPANLSFFSLDATQEIKEMLTKQGIDSLVRVENDACRRLMFNASYAQLVQLLRLLVITGDALVSRKDNAVRVRSLKSYVVRRNHLGEDQHIIYKDCIRYDELPPYVKTGLGTRKDDDVVTLYTSIKRIIKWAGNIPITSWEETQEVEGVAVNYKQTYTHNTCPHFTVMWSHVNGDNYGRGYVGEYAGDFAKLSELSQSLTEYQLASCITLNVYNPSGNFDIDRAEQARNGDWITGQKEAVQSYEVGDYNKMIALSNDIQLIMTRLNTAFMVTSNQRDAERVTQYEIMTNANEAEQVLGGVYSQLSQNLHMPLAYLLLNEIHPAIIQDIEAGAYELNILTGLQALSRSSANQALLVASSEINATVPVLTQVSKRFDVEKIIDSILRSNGINVEDYTFTEEQIQARTDAEEQEQAQLAQQQAIMQGAGQQQAVQAVQQSQGIM